jgi:hypothetical protein
MLRGYQRTTSLREGDSWIYLARQCNCRNQWIHSQQPRHLFLCQQPRHLFLCHTHQHCKCITNVITQVRR